MRFRHTLTTRYSETAQDGIIHHSSYIVYLEVARIAFLKSLGYDINTVEKNSMLCPVVDLSIHYIKPLYSLTEINIEVFIESHTKVRFTLGYRLLLGETLIATASTSNCFISSTFKPLPIPKDLLNKFSTT